MDTPPKIHRAQLFQAAELLGAVLTGAQPADRQMDLYFRAHRNMGKRDRGFVAEAVYGCLRRRRFLEALLAGRQTDAEQRPRLLVAAWLLAENGWSARALERFEFIDDPADLAARLHALKAEPLPFAVRASLPDWLAERLLAELGEEEAERLAQALNRPATLDLRVNSLKATREQARARLADEGYTTEPTPFSPVGLRREERAALFGTQSFREGWVEVQDEGSQLIGLLVAAQPREQVMDFCAGAGGKTLHLGALMANTGSLYAADVSAARLERIKPRLARAGVDNVRLRPLRGERDARLSRLEGRLDRVLVDAPCSGTGTLRRNPDIKWRPIDLATLTATQQRILDAAARLLRPGGRLVYATCSLLTEENEAIVGEFLATHPQFRCLDAAEVLHAQGIVVPEAINAQGQLRLYPHRHGTDGFFAAVLERGS